LRNHDLPEEIELFDGGTLGVDLMPWLEGREKLIFIDSVKGGQKPGTLYRFNPDDLNYSSAPKTSVHQIGLIESLQMISLIGKTPGNVVIFGVEPGTIDWGEELTEDVQKSIPKLIDHIKKEIKVSIKELKNLETEETNG
jgi:hydrogenase maturation protease